MKNYQRITFIVLVLIALSLQTNYFKSLSWYTTKIEGIAAIAVLILTLMFVFITKKQNTSTYLILGLGVVFVLVQYFIK
jgi:hypothetical protein